MTGLCIHLPPPPYGYSSFPKEEIQDTIDFLVSLFKILLIII